MNPTDLGPNFRPTLSGGLECLAGGVWTHVPHAAQRGLETLQSDLSSAREEIAALRWYFARYGDIPIGDALPIVSKTQAKEAAVLEALRSSRTKGE